MGRSRRGMNVIEVGEVSLCFVSVFFFFCLNWCRLFFFCVFISVFLSFSLSVFLCCVSRGSYRVRVGVVRVGVVRVGVVGVGIVGVCGRARKRETSGGTARLYRNCQCRVEKGGSCVAVAKRGWMC